MRTVGEILSEKRKQLGLSLENIEKETKIRKKFLEAIEKNNFPQIEGSTVVKGFIRNYALILNLDPENLLAVFRRDFRENEKGQIIPRSMVEPLKKDKFYWTPKATFILIFSLLLGGFAFLFVRQYFKFSSAPSLQLLSPEEGEIFKEKVLVLGKTDKDVSVKVDGTLISVSDNGQFSEQIVLPRGDDIVTIEAINRQGKKTTINRKVKIE